MYARRLLLQARDEDVLRLLDRTPATAALILKASRCFAEPFENLRRVRERMQALAGAGLVRSWIDLTRKGFSDAHGSGISTPFQ